MPKMTKAQLVDENIRLRHNLNLLEAKLAELATQRMAAGPCVVGDILAIDRSRPARRPGDEIVVATYTKRDGTRWDKIRTGWNTYVHRQQV